MLADANADAREAVAAVAQDPGTPEERVLAGVRVLVVDDSEINRDVVKHILCDQGAVPSFACDGRQALDWLLAHPADVDIVLMDVQMPVMDGLQATRALRQLPQFQDLPVVALTAGAFQTQRTAALEAGVNHFISKPFDVPQTIALIARAHRRHAQGLPALPPFVTEATMRVPPAQSFTCLLTPPTASSMSRSRSSRVILVIRVPNTNASTSCKPFEIVCTNCSRMRL